jgi:hypothetical protein
MDPPPEEITVSLVLIWHPAARQAARARSGIEDFSDLQRLAGIFFTTPGQYTFPSL